MTHNLKILKPYFEAVAAGDKTFELRKDDRPYKTGDTIILNEIGAGNVPTGRKIKKKIGCILRDCPEYGLFRGYCILSLLEV